MVFGKLTQALKNGLQKTREKVVGGLKTVLPFGRDLDDDLIEEMEEYLYTADMGPRTVAKITEAVQGAYKAKEIRTTDECFAFLKDYLKNLLRDDQGGLRRAPNGPTVVLVAGVNGSGKTTSIAKLAHRLSRDGDKVLLAAADTFRAAAVEQLVAWSERIGCQIVRQQTGSDPAAVAFDAAEAAVSRDVDWLIVDTAGRLHTQKNLMQELDKIKRVITKKIPDAPHETILVLDANTGQNAINQAAEFSKVLDITGLFLTKLDGTAKGGAIIGIRDQVAIPIRFIGVGEKQDHIEDFDAETYVEGLFELEDVSTNG